MVERRECAGDGRGIHVQTIGVLRLNGTVRCEKRVKPQPVGRYRYPNPRTVSIASRPSKPSFRRR
jgi:hypothetical protein